MASIRHHTHIDAQPDEVWAVVADYGNIAEWVPSLESSFAEERTRTVSMAGGLEIIEEIVTLDPELRRLQYEISGGPMVPEEHRATVDVLEDGDGTLVVYSCDVKPDDVEALMDPIIGDLVASLKAHCER